MPRLMMAIVGAPTSLVNGSDRQERSALARARREAPEQCPSVAIAAATSTPTTAPGERNRARGQRRAAANAARPDFDDETADGPGAIEVEVRYAAEVVRLPIEHRLDGRCRR